VSDRRPVSRKRIKDLLVASVRYRGRYEECGDYFSKLEGQVKEQICGPAFCLYTDQVGEQGVDIECCFPVRQPVEVGEVKSRVLVGGDVLAITHYGPYRTLGESWEALFDYIEGHNIRVKGPRREIYLQDSPDGQVTELQVPLEKQA